MSQWIIMDYHGLSWIVMDYHGLSWIVMDYHMDYHGLSLLFNTDRVIPMNHIISVHFFIPLKNISTRHSDGHNLGAYLQTDSFSLCCKLNRYSHIVIHKKIEPYIYIYNIRIQNIYNTIFICNI